MQSKIKIKMGAIEVEYEGSENFLKEELPELIAAISELHKSSGSIMAPVDGTPIEQSQTTMNGAKTKYSGTTNTIAAKIGGATGVELIAAAAAQIHFVQGKETFSKKDLQTAVKSASSYYKTTYMSNFGQYMKTLLKDKRLSETATDTYALPAAEIARIEPQLA